MEHGSYGGCYPCATLFCETQKCRAPAQMRAELDPWKGILPGWKGTAAISVCSGRGQVARRAAGPG